jgi:hypothetical protein
MPRGLRAGGPGIPAVAGPGCFPAPAVREGHAETLHQAAPRFLFPVGAALLHVGLADALPGKLWTVQLPLRWMCSAQ